MPGAREEINVEALKNLVQSGQKKFVRYDEGKVLYSMGLHSFLGEGLSTSVLRNAKITLDRL